MGWVKLRDNLISPLMELKSISPVADPDQKPPKKSGSDSPSKPGSGSDPQEKPDPCST